MDSVSSESLSEYLQKLDGDQQTYLSKHISSFAQVRGSNGGGGDVHARCMEFRPCECPQMPGGEDDDCVARRLQLITNVYDSLDKADLSNTLNVNGALLKLRNKYMELPELTNQTHIKTVAISTNLSTSILPKSEKTMRKLLSSQYDLALISNNAWMNLIAVTNLVSKDMRSTKDISNEIAEKLTKFITQIQQFEDDITYKNGKRVVEILNDAVQGNVEMVNEIFSSLSILFSKIENFPNLQPDSGTELVQSLEDAVEDINSKISTIPPLLETLVTRFNDSLTDMVSEEMDSNRHHFNNLIYDMQTMVNKKLMAFSAASHANGKKQSNSTSEMLHKTVVDIRQSFVEFSNKFEEFENKTIGMYEHLTTKFLSSIDQFQEGYFKSSLENSTATLNDNRGKLKQVQSKFEDLKNGENRLKLTAVTDESTAANNVQSEVSRVSSGMPKYRTDIIVNAQKISSGAVSAVGTSTLDSLSSIREKNDLIADSRAQQSNTAATELNRATNSLSSSTQTAGAMIDSSSENMQGKIGSAMNGVYDSLGKAGVSIVGVGGSSNMVQEKLQMAGGETRSKTLAMIQTAQESDADSASESAASDSQDMVDKILGNMDISSTNITSKSRALRSSLSDADSIDMNLGFGAKDGDEKNRNILSNTAGKIAEREELFGDMLNQLFKGVDGTHLSPSVHASSSSSIISDTKSQISDAESQFLTSSSSLDSAESDAEDLTNEASKKAAQIGTSTKDKLDDVQRRLSDQISAGSGDVNSVQSLVSENAASVAASRTLDINNLNTNAQSKISMVDIDILGDARHTASTALTLMNRMNQFLNTNNVDLLSQMTELPAKFQSTLGPRIVQVEGEVNSMESDAMDTFENLPIHAGDPDGLKRKIYNLNSTAMEAIASVTDRMNKSASSFLVDVGVDVRDMVSEFNDLDNSITAGLGKINTENQADTDAYIASLVGGTNLIDPVEDLLSKLSKQRGIQATLIRDPVLFSPTTGKVMNANKYMDMSMNVTRDARKILNDAASTTVSGRDAVAAAKIAAEAASDKVAQVDRAGLADEESQIGDLTGQWDLKSSLAKHGTDGQVNSWTKISSDMRNVVSDLSDQVKADVEKKTSSSSVVFNNIIASQSKLKKIMGDVAAKAAAISNDLGTTTSGNVAEIAIQSMNLKRGIGAMIDAFTGYLESQNIHFNQATEGMNIFDQSLILRVEQMLKQNVDEMENESRKWNSSSDAVNASVSSLMDRADQFTYHIQDIENQVDGFINSTRDSIDDERDALYAIGNTTKSSLYEDISNQIGGIVKRLAQDAIDSIQAVGMNVPERLRDIANEPNEDIAGIGIADVQNTPTPAASPSDTTPAPTDASDTTVPPSGPSDSTDSTPAPDISETTTASTTSAVDTTGSTTALTTSAADTTHTTTALTTSAADTTDTTTALTTSAADTTVTTTSLTTPAADTTDTTTALTTSAADTTETITELTTSTADTTDTTSASTTSAADTTDTTTELTTSAADTTEITTDAATTPTPADANSVDDSSTTSG